MKKNYTTERRDFWKIIILITMCQKIILITINWKSDVNNIRINIEKKDNSNNKDKKRNIVKKNHKQIKSKFITYIHHKEKKHQNLYSKIKRLCGKLKKKKISFGKDYVRVESLLLSQSVFLPFLVHSCSICFILFPLSSLSVFQHETLRWPSNAVTGLINLVFKKFIRNNFFCRYIILKYDY
jgi:hypothetical protein